MKKMILKVIVIATVLMASGCNMDMTQDAKFSGKLSVNLYDIKVDYSIQRFINHNIDYVSDGDNDVWSDAKTTINKNGGDCDDFSILYLNLLYSNKGVKANIILVHTDNSRAVVNGGPINHMIVELPDGTQIEPQNGQVVNYEIGYRYTFDEVFNASSRANPIKL